MHDNVAGTRQHAIGDIPRRTAKRYPDKLAIVDGDTRISFAEFESLVARAAAGLAASGLAKGDRLALLSRNCWQFPVVTFATARLGIVCVPINFMLGPAEIAFILEHSGAGALVVEDALTPVADEALAGLALERRWSIPLGGVAAAGWRAFDELLAAGTPPAAPVPMADDDPVRLMYTSGTESRPKGVLLSSRSLLWQYVSCVVDGAMSADDVELHSLPLYHCAQLDCFLSVDIYLGATSVIVRGPEPSSVIAAIGREGVTKYFAPPTVWISLLRAPGFAAAAGGLRKAYYGASAMPVEVLKELMSTLPAVRFWNFYGQTEMSPLATILGPDEQLDRAGSAGRAALNVETRVVAEDGSALPSGEVGEIVHRSPHATLGYFDDDAKTAEAFAGGWFHSGDLGWLDAEGVLTVVDRKKDMIKTGGENVASREVEEAIYGIEGVAEVAVFGVPHPTWVEAVVAAVVPGQGVSLTEAAVIEAARARLAGYKTPKHVVFTDALPKNPSGKILKRALRERYAGLAG